MFVSITMVTHYCCNYHFSDVEAFSNKTIITKKEGWSDELQGIPRALTDIMILHNTMSDELPNKYKMLQ